MPISRERAREIVQRTVGGRELLTIKQGLSPVPVEDLPLPPRVPAGSEWSAEALRERREFLSGLGVQTPALAGEASIDPESLRGNIEHYIGMAQVPVGLIGPLRLAGLHARGDVYEHQDDVETAEVDERLHGGRQRSGAIRDHPENVGTGARDPRTCARSPLGARRSGRLPAS